MVSSPPPRPHTGGWHWIHQISWGDVPTWCTFLAAALAFALALQQFRKQTRQLERQQANDVDSFWGREPGISIPNTPIATVGRAFVVVDNKSGRPIRKVTCQLHPAGGPSLSASMIGPARSRDEAHPHLLTLDNPWSGSEAKVIRAHDKFGFLFDTEFPNPSDEIARTVQFTDDADLSWTIDEDLHLKRMRGDRTDPRL